MRRRSFLGLFGAAVTAPLMPSVSVARAGQAAAYSGAAMHGAIMHAQTHSAFSVWNLAQALKLPIGQAEALMGDMAKRGIIGPLQGVTHGGRWASSKIALRETLVASKAIQNSHGADSAATHPHAESDLSTLIAHLRQVCVDYGMTLHPRCAVS